MKKTKLFLLTTLTLLIAFAFQQCREDDLNWDDSDVPFAFQTQLQGTVVDDQQQPIPNAMVTHLDNTTTTDQNGFFQFETAYVVKGRAHVMVEKNSFFTNCYAFHTSKPHTTIQVMLSNKQSKTVSSTALSEVVMETGKATVQLPANGLKDANGNAYSGMVEVAYKHYNPTDDFFGLQMPGGDFRAIDANGEERFLESYGAVSVELYDESGNELQIAEGETATIRVEVPDDMLADAPPTMPLWYFDEEEAKWIEEGQASLVGTEYIGEVSHFSAWNIDKPLDPRAFVAGYVLDCNNEPLENIHVSVGPLVITTDENGYYNTNIALGYDFEVQAQAQYNIGLSSQAIQVPAINTGGGQQLENLIMPCVTTISGSVQSCNGSNTGASIYAKWSNGNNLIYSEDGNFSINIPSNETIELSAITDDRFIGRATASSNNEGSDVVLSQPILACDNLSNDCLIATCILNDEPFTFLADTYQHGPLDLYSADSSVWFLIEILGSGTTGVALQNETAGFHIIVPEVAVGTYEMKEFPSDTHIIYATNNLSESFILDIGTIAITEVGPDYIRGSFSGQSSNSELTALLGVNGFDNVVTEGYFCIPY